MAINVVITPGGLFKKEYSLQDLIMDGMRYGSMDEAFRLVENQEDDITVLFNSEHICRGMEINFEDKKIILRLPMPNDEKDIRFFYDFIKHICQICHTQKFERDEKIATVFDAEKCIGKDIDASQFALNLIADDIRVQQKTITIFGAINPIVIGPDEMNAIDNDLNKFGEFMNTCQQMDAYYATPSAYKMKDESIIGVYVINSDVVSIVSLKPSLLMNTDIKVNAWYAQLGISANETVMVNYNDFIEYIDKSRRYDGDHVIINISQNDMSDFARAHKVEL